MCIRDRVTSQEDSASYTTRMHSLPEDTSADSEGYLNQLTLIEGRMPEEAGECVIVLTKSFSGDTEWIGQTLRQDPDGEAAEGLPDEFTVVGLSLIHISGRAAGRQALGPGPQPAAQRADHL